MKIIITISFCLILISSVVKGQSRAIQLNQDTASLKIAKQMGISFERAQKLRTILSLANTEMQHAKNDSKLSMQQRQQQLKWLAQQLKKQVDSLYTNEEKEKFRIANPALAERRRAFKEKLQRRQDMGSKRADSTVTIPKP